MQSHLPKTNAVVPWAHSITMSLGLLLSQEWGFRPVEELLHETDVAVYAAEAAGRNCGKLASPTAPSTAPEPQEQEHIWMRR